MGADGLWDYDWAKCFWALGFEMDCGHSLNDTTGLLLGDERDLAHAIDNIEDVSLLGNAAFSECRYITHWSLGPSDGSIGRIVMILRRIEKLTENGEWNNWHVASMR